MPLLLLLLLLLLLFLLMLLPSVLLFLMVMLMLVLRVCLWQYRAAIEEDMNMEDGEEGEGEVGMFTVKRELSSQSKLHKYSTNKIKKVNIHMCPTHLKTHPRPQTTDLSVEETVCKGFSMSCTRFCQ